jgi:hypothetical protein
LRIDGRKRLVIDFSYTDYKVTVFERNSYDQNGYSPEADAQAASVDLNKIVSATFNDELGEADGKRE